MPPTKRTPTCHPERVYEANGLCASCYVTSRNKKFPDAYRLKERKRTLRRHNMTEEQFNDLLLAQNNRCAICGIILVLTKDIHIDHDHDTGLVRGLLCNGCNRNA